MDEEHDEDDEQERQNVGGRGGVEHGEQAPQNLPGAHKHTHTHG